MDEEPLKMKFMGQAPIEIVVDVGTHFVLYKITDAVPKAEVPPEESEPVKPVNVPSTSNIPLKAPELVQEPISNGGWNAEPIEQELTGMTLKELRKAHGVVKGNKLWNALKGK